MFTGTGALLITATEFMEQVLGQGLIGGVAVAFFSLASEGVLSVIDGMSSRLILQTTQPRRPLT